MLQIPNEYIITHLKDLHPVYEVRQSSVFMSRECPSLTIFIIVTHPNLTAMA